VTEEDVRAARGRLQTSSPPNARGVHRGRPVDESAPHRAVRRFHDPPRPRRDMRSRWTYAIRRVARVVTRRGMTHTWSCVIPGGARPSIPRLGTGPAANGVPIGLRRATDRRGWTRCSPRPRRASSPRQLLRRWTIWSAGGEIRLGRMGPGSDRGVVRRTVGMEARAQQVECLDRVGRVGVPVLFDDVPVLADAEWCGAHADAPREVEPSADLAHGAVYELEVVGAAEP
jgi:hypothetical protein